MQFIVGLMRCPTWVNASVWEQLRKYKHGSYERYADVDSDEKIQVQRYLLVDLGITVSVLPDGMLSYRGVKLDELESYFDEVYGQCPVSASVKRSERLLGCLKRAAKRFEQRSRRLLGLFGGLVDGCFCAEQLWVSLRRRLGNLATIVHYLWCYYGVGLLGDYVCMRCECLRF